MVTVLIVKQLQTWTGDKRVHTDEPLNHDTQKQKYRQFGSRVQNNCSPNNCVLAHSMAIAVRWDRAKYTLFTIKSHHKFRNFEFYWIACVCFFFADLLGSGVGRLSEKPFWREKKNLLASVFEAAASALQYNGQHSCRFRTKLWAREGIFWLSPDLICGWCNWGRPRLCLWCIGCIWKVPLWPPTPAISRTTNCHCGGKYFEFCIYYTRKSSSTYVGLRECSEMVRRKAWQCLR